MGPSTGFTFLIRGIHAAPPFPSLPPALLADAALRGASMPREPPSRAAPVLPNSGPRRGHRLGRRRGGCLALRQP